MRSTQPMVELRKLQSIPHLREVAYPLLRVIARLREVVSALLGEAPSQLLSEMELQKRIFINYLMTESAEIYSALRIQFIVWSTSWIVTEKALLKCDDYNRLTTDMFKIRSKHMALLEQADNDVIEHERTALDKKLIYKDVVFDLRSNEDAKDQISLKLSEMAHLYCMQRIEKSQQIRACTDAIKFRRTNPQVQVPRQGKMLMEQHNKNTIYNTEGDVGVEVVRIRAIIKDLIKNEVCLIVLDNGMGMSGDRIHAVAPTVNHHLGCCTGKSHCLC